MKTFVFWAKDNYFHTYPWRHHIWSCIHHDDGDDDDEEDEDLVDDDEEENGDGCIYHELPSHQDPAQLPPCIIVIIILLIL